MLLLVLLLAAANGLSVGLLILWAGKIKVRHEAVLVAVLLWMLAAAVWVFQTLDAAMAQVIL